MKKVNSKTICFVCLLLVSVQFFKTDAAEGKTVSRPEAELMIFAAASLAEAISEISDSFENVFQIKVKKNLASSGTLARQIAQGGVPDLFISADKKWIDYIDSLGYMQKGFIVPVARNQLVIIAPKESHFTQIKIDNSLDVMFLLGSGRLSMGDPVHVPAGKYAKAALEYFGLYEKVKTRILPAKDVRSALMVVEMRESPLGLVYRTDALKSKKVKILATFPENSHGTIVYLAGLCKNSDAGKGFFNFLNSNKTEAIWTRYNFKKP